ncbi:MAG: PadR family transcriptional regulator [Candidatus Nanopelagicales bacterium]
MARRSDVVELAVLGLLNEGPQHGYELRKRLNSMLGTFRAISYGSLYPALKNMLAKGWIAEDGPADAGAPALSNRRARIVYKLTADGKEHLQQLLDESGPDAWEDESFNVHMSFFSRTTADARLRILQGRRSRLEERRASMRSATARQRERLDDYTTALQQHGLEGVEREVRWLTELIANEESGGGRRPAQQERR